MWLLQLNVCLHLTVIWGTTFTAFSCLCVSTMRGCCKAILHWLVLWIQPFKMKNCWDMICFSLSLDTQKLVWVSLILLPQWINSTVTIRLQSLVTAILSLTTGLNHLLHISPHSLPPTFPVILQLIHHKKENKIKRKRFEPCLTNYVLTKYCTKAETLELCCQKQT